MCAGCTIRMRRLVSVKHPTLMQESRNAPLVIEHALVVLGRVSTVPVVIQRCREPSIKALIAVLVMMASMMML